VSTTRYQPDAARLLERSALATFASSETIERAQGASVEEELRAAVDRIEPL